ncbi:OLC1v1025047C1 [Oldenlandia corymbosa var. corymbosa]|uniref:OLC1v1025047C1 n=1 Tax=Oldenlandia corymbosa var. corymbosa TaxID=529605 RepID=A0AAV1C3V4_OLDCO|nr:OLC1v1025047C1 [Oldenlandia corymbosa var. corymbosa]
MELGQREYMCSSSSHKFVGSEEESGWTKYLKDFSSSDNNDQQREKSSYSNGISPSMVSDAASPSYRHHATLSNIWAFNKEEVNLAFSTVSGQHFPKKLNVKQPRNKKYFLDHDLEDTASSPVNSPRVSGVKHTNDVDDGVMHDGIFLGKKSGHAPQFQANEKGSIINVELASQVAVPISTFPNYLA